MKAVEALPFCFVLYIVAIMARNHDAEVRDLLICLFGGMGFRMLPQSSIPDIVRKAGPTVVAIFAFGASRLLFG